MNNVSHQFRCPLLYLRKNKKARRSLALFMTVALLHLTVGCTYYKIKEVPISTENIGPELQKFNDGKHYAILNQSWYLSNVTINADERVLSGTVQPLGAEHAIDNIRKIKKTYRINKNKQPLNELHFEVDMSLRPEIGESLIIPFGDIRTITVNDRNTGRTVLNATLGTVGIIFATFLIILALKSSCPFVYIKEGEAYVFKGELYPGAITPNLQRLDYLPLAGFKADSDHYQLKVTNELQEVQYTDLLQLWVVEHEKNTQVLLDKNGKVHSFSKEILPKRVIDATGKDARLSLLHKDDTFHGFNEDVVSTTSTRSLQLEFERPPGAQHAKLLLTAKNSLWLDYIFGKFNAQFGSYYPQFQKDQQGVSAAKSEQWIQEQHIPMSVFLKTDQGWELVERLSTVGPMATRDIVVPLALGKLSGDRVVVRLECGFMFWELDYASMDFSENQEVALTKIEPDLAMDENNIDVLAALRKSDGEYLVQPEIGNEVVVAFKALKKSPHRSQSVFLVNKGYYNYIREYQGIPDFTRLKSFREAGRFTRYSENAYKAIMAVDQPLNAAL